jgi:hypothetical protein
MNISGEERARVLLLNKKCWTFNADANSGWHGDICIYILYGSDCHDSIVRIRCRCCLVFPHARGCPTAKLEQVGRTKKVRRAKGRG